MKPTDPQADDWQRLESMILAFDDSLNGGGEPSFVDDSTLPAVLASKLRGMKAALQMLDQARVTGLGQTGCLEPAGTDSSTSDNLNASSIRGQWIGRFELISELGRGGHGVVFLANDAQLGRRVALKIPRPEVLVSAEARRRFLREAQAAGALEHPNLIPVYEVGEEGPFCFIATAHCEGPTLAEWVKGHPAAISSRTAAMLVRALAGGVEHAHQRGVLHRDIKPSNVLMDRSIEGVLNETGAVPRLTDFGLAKLLEVTEEQTRSGSLLGTPAYMAPEQAESRLSDIGPATDVYALGVMLYELLAGRPPFRGESDIQTLQLVSRNDVPPLAPLRSDIARDLEAIALKCLEREPVRRYASARHLAEDLDRFLKGVPTEARLANSLERIWKAARRRPGLTAMGGIAAAAVITLAVGGWWHSTQLRFAFEQLQVQKQETDQHLYAASMTLAHQAIETHHIQHAYEHLARWIPRSGEPDLRSFSWHHLWRQLHDEELTLAGHTGDVYCVRYSPDGTKLVTASQDRTARIWDVATGKCLFVLAGHEGDVNCVSMSHNGDYVATVCDDGSVYTWLTVNGKLNSKTTAHAGGAIGVAFSPTENSLLATCGTDQKITLQNVASGKPLAQWQAHNDSIGALAFSPSGKLLASASDDKSVGIWNVAHAKLERRLQLMGSVNNVCFSGDESQLLTSERSRGAVKLWDVQSGDLVKLTSQHYEWVHAIAFDRADRFYAVATKDGAVELIDPSDGGVQRRFPGHAARAWSLSFSSDGRHLATSSADRTVKIWNLDDRPEMIDDSPCVSAMSQTPDGSQIVTGTSNGHISIYDVSTRLAGWHTGNEQQVVGDFNGDGQQDLGTFVDGHWRLHITNGNSQQTSELSLTFGVAGDRPVVGDWDGDGLDDLGYFRSGTNQFGLDLDRQGGDPELVRELGPSDVRSDCMVPLVGRWEEGNREGVGIASFVSGVWYFKFLCQDKVVWTRAVRADDLCIPLAGRWQTGQPDGWGLWDRAAGVWIERLRSATGHQPAPGEVVIQSPAFSLPDPLPMHPAALDAAYDLVEVRRVQSLAISPDGARVAVSCSDNHRLNIWDVHTGRKTQTLRTDSGKIMGAAFSPDGSTLAVATSLGALALHDAHSLQLVRRIQAHDNTLIQLGDSHDGRLLATIGDSNVLNIWDSRGRRLRSLSDAAPKNHVCLAFSPDDRLIVVGGEDRIVRVWNVATGQKIAALAGHTRSVTGVAFSPDARCLATVGEDGAIRIWDLHTRQELYTLVKDLKPFTSIAFVGQELVAIGQRNDWRGKRATIQFWPTGRRGR